MTMKREDITHTTFHRQKIKNIERYNGQESDYTSGSGERRTVFLYYDADTASCYGWAALLGEWWKVNGGRRKVISPEAIQINDSNKKSPLASERGFFVFARHGHI